MSQEVFPLTGAEIINYTFCDCLKIHILKLHLHIIFTKTFFASLRASNPINSAVGYSDNVLSIVPGIH